jgi:hypothetical protein
MATRQWAVSTNGTDDFNNPANWAFGIVPGVVDIAQFNTGAIDTVSGNATIAEILISNGTYSLAGTYTISGAQATELSVTGGTLTILPSASIDGDQAVSVNGAVLEVQGGLAASGLDLNGGTVFVDQGSSLVVSGPITMSNLGALISRPAPGQTPGAPITITASIQASGTVYLGSYSKQEVDFDDIISGTGLVAPIGDGQTDTVALNGNNTFSGGTAIGSPNLTVAVGNPNALGTGKLTLTGGELLATTTETIANLLQLTPSFTIAATLGHTLTIGTGFWIFTPNGSQAITFGAPGHDGNVVFEDSGGASILAGSYTVSVKAGTVRDGKAGSRSWSAVPRT